jgi:L-iditol 2-dehydrogenase
MRAARFIGTDRIEIEEVPPPVCGTDEIVVSVHRAGICGTDLRIFRGRKAVDPPVTLGHEFAGTIVEAGDGVRDLPPGTRVTVEPIIPCGTCYCCRTGRENICLTRPTIGYQYDGGFADRVRIPAEAIRAGNVIPVPDGLGFDEACYAEPLAACINGMEKLAPGPGERVWVAGDGPIGLTHLQLARARGVESVYLSGTREERLAAGTALGAADVFDVTGGGDPAGWIADRTGGEGVDAVVLATNATGAIADAMASLRKGGRLLLFAGYPPETTHPFDLAAIHYREHRILGASGHAARDVRRAIELMASGEFRAAPLITHHLPLESIREGLEMKESFVGLKHIIDVS